MLDKKTIDLVKSSVPALREKGVEITKTFYHNMFTQNPEIAPMFNMDRQKTGEQPKALAMTVLAAAQNIEQLEKLMPAVENIAKRHVACQVKPEHYPIIGKHLLHAMKEVLQEDASDELLEAWGKAYEVIAQVFIDVEANMYQAQ